MTDSEFLFGEDRRRVDAVGTDDIVMVDDHGTRYLMDRNNRRKAWLYYDGPISEVTI